MKNKLLKELEKLSEIVWGEDIPSPTIPEYVQLHESMSKIQNKLQCIIVMARERNDVIISSEDLGDAIESCVGNFPDADKYDAVFAATRDFVRFELSNIIAEFVENYEEER